MFDEEQIIQEIKKSPRPVSASELARRFHVRGPQRREFRKLLEQIARSNRIARLPGKRFTMPSTEKSVVLGRLQITSRGFGFVRPDWGPKQEPIFKGDLFIPQRHMRDALDGDTVKAAFDRVENEGPVGRIESVVERAQPTVVGWYQTRGKKGGVVTPRNSKMDRKINVAPPKKDFGIKDFDWVMVKITEYTRAPDALVGEVVERLGDEEDKGIDVLLVIRDLGIIEEFSPSTLQDAEDLEFDWENDLKDRTDFKNHLTITIDPKTAKDYDDALSIEKLGGGGWKLFVHIADVAHFLQQGTGLDDEALERATSVYPVDRVVPMLPERISNYLCSLVPHEDRLTMSAEIDISPSGEILGSRFHNSVIHSDQRFAYEQVQAIFDGQQPLRSKFEEYLPMLEDLRACAQALRTRRFDRGALDLDIPELNVIFDETGAATDLQFYPRFEAHKLVEECMLIANEAVAQHMEKNRIPILYRIHEVADEDRLEKVAGLLRYFGIKLSSGDGGISQFDIQRALEQVQKLEAGHILPRLILRAMKRAEYDPENLGHFGLASECYCHFTSPIRRYPDVIVHRQLKAHIRNNPLPYDSEDNDLDNLGEHTSRLERRAQQAEWEATEIKSLEFMKRYEGQEFEAWVASVTSFGFFVEIAQHPVEGLIHRTQLKGDRYEMDDLGVMMVGKKTGHSYKLGDKVKVQIMRVDPMARKLELELLEQPELMGRLARKQRKMRSSPQSNRRKGGKRRK